MAKEGIAPNLVTYHALLKACRQAGAAERALMTFEEIEERCVLPSLQSVQGLSLIFGVLNSVRQHSSLLMLGDASSALILMTDLKTAARNPQTPEALCTWLAEERFLRDAIKPWP
jgi:pentatricopeptide repeat protein